MGTPAPALESDTGTSASDHVTSDGTVTVSGLEAGASYEYSTDGGTTWVAGTGTSFELAAGTYTDVEVRQTDVAGNVSEAASLGTVTVLTPPTGDLTAVLANDTGVSASDGITSDGTVTVGGIAAGSTYEYSTDGGATWQAGTGETGTGGASFTLPEGTYSDVQVREVDAAGNPGAPTSLGGVTVDTGAPDAPLGALVQDTGISDSDQITSNGTVAVSGLEAGASFEYSTDGGTTWVAGTGTSFTLGAGTYEDVQVRQIDVAGNVGEAASLGAVTVDTSAAAPALALESDTGTSASDHVTSDGTVTVSGLEDGASYEYSTDGGTTWQAGTGTSFTLGEGTYADVQVRQSDTAGNVSAAALLGAVTVDTSAAAPVVALASDTGTSNSDQITSDGTVTVSGLEDGATYEYSTDGGATWVAGTGTSFELAAGTYTDVEVRQTDVAGNVSEPASLGTVTVLTPPTGDLTAVLANDTGVSASDAITSDGTVTVGGIAAGSTYEYSTDGGATWQAGTGETGTGGASFTLPEGTYSDVQVREVDAAGNPGAPTSLGGVTVDTGAPNAPLAGLVQDTGSSDADQITSNGTVAVSGLEAGASFEYSTDGGTTWVAGTGTSFTLGAGTYEDVQVRQIDVAGNVGEAASLGSVTVDVSAGLPALALESDTGTSASDHVTSDGTVAVSGLEAGASFEYSTDGGTTWVAGTGTSFTLGAGTYEDVQVRQIDVAGNVGEAASLGAVTVDTSAAAPAPALESDTGTSASDHVTSDGTVTVSGLEDGASYEYSTDGGTTWQAGTGTSFTLGEGTYADVQVRQSDAAGNVSAAASLGAVTVDIPVAVDDASTLNMGAQSSVTQPAQTDTDVQVLGLTESTVGTDNSVTISVPAGDTGSVRIEVDQTALVAVADAYRLDVIDSNGNVVYSAVTPDSLVGDVAGLHVLGLTGNDGLVAIVEGLQPGNYQVVVRNDESALAQLLDTDGGGVSLQELGQAGVVLGPNNQTLVLDAVDNALGGGLLGDTARGLLETALNLTTNLGVGDLVGILTTVLGNPLVNATGLLDNVLGAVSDTLLSNTLTLLQSTSITTQVTDYSYANETVTGNAIQGGANGGQDHLGGGATITQIANSDGDTVALSATGNTSIVGEYGVLTIAANGAYSYSAFGNPNSAGHSDVFTYTLSDGHSSDTATITVGIQGAAVSAAGDVATAGIHWNNVVDNNYYNANASLIGALGTQTYNSSNIVIGANETVSGSIIVSTTVSALANGVVQIQELTGTNTWTTVGTANYNIGVGVLGQIASINLSTLNLDAGTYRVHTTLNGVLSTLNIATDVNVTYTNQYVHDTSTIATGNILTNDHQGSLVTELEVYNRTTGAYVDVDAGSPVTVAGQYGSLLLNADGSYTYTPYATQSHFTTAQVDSFQYQLVHPSGQIATATLAVTVQPSGAGIPTTAVASTLSAESDTATTTHSLLATTSVGAETVSTEGLTAANDDTASSHALAAKAATSAVAYDMFEGQGSLETVLEGYLDRVHPRTETDTTTPLPTVSESSQDTSIAAVSNDDPLGYLDMHPQILREDQSSHHLQV